MLKSDKDSKVSLGMRCGNCLHYKAGPAKFEDKCCNLGIQAYAKAPNCFSPNIYLLTKVDDDILVTLGKAMRDMTSAQLRVLTFTVRSAAALAKEGLKFGQPVFFSLGGDYLIHYFKGYVVSVSHDAEHIIVSSKLKGQDSKATLTLMRGSILTLSEFKEKKAKLLKAKRIEPKGQDKSIAGAIHHDTVAQLLRKVHDEDYTPPTLDSVDASWLDRRASVPKADSYFDTKTPTRKVASKKTDSGNVVKISRSK